MPGGKDNKPRLIAEKYSIEYYRRPKPTRVWKSPWNYAAIGLAVTLVAAIYSVERKQAFQAAHLSAAHASFAQNCAACHEVSWQPAMRLVTLDASHYSVPDAACQKCHHPADHVAGLVPSGHCASCHQEHRTESELTAVADSHCTQCHRDLQLPDGAAVSFVSAIETCDEGKAGHPEFALHRSTDGAVGPRHGARKLAVFVTGDDQHARWLDRGGVKFNHQLHLNPAGVKAPGRELEILTCASCHVPEENGRIMRPIVYESHCQRCHPLRLSEQLSGLGEAPHGSVDEVYGFLRRAKLAELNTTHESRSAATPNFPSPRDAVKTRLPIQSVLSQQEETELHAAADQVVFGRQAERLCYHCHHIVARGETWEILSENPDVVGDQAAVTATGEPSMVPARWMLHAQFDHESHCAIACGECHAAADSSRTADILMPSIATCRACHGNSSETATGRVRADCVLCHAYHGEARDSGGLPLDQLITLTGAQAVRNPSP